MSQDLIKLKVAEAREEYIGKNIITLDISIKQKLNLISGDVIEIKGDKITAAQVWPDKIRSGDENIIRMDQYQRQNAGVSIGDFVTIKKIEPKIAHEIILTPIKEVNLLSENTDLLIKKNFLGRPFVSGNTILISIFGAGYFYEVTSTIPEKIVILSEESKLILNKKPSKKISSKTIIGYEDVGGLKAEIEKIREMVELPFKYPEFFEKLNVSSPKGILLYGPPGTGKTLLAKALSNELKVNFISLDAPQIMAKYVGEAEERLRKIFKQAQDKAPCIIFIDEIDAIAPKRDSLISEVEKRVVAQLLALMDGMDSRGDVIVIGATNRQSDVDSALRRPGRFDREIDIGVPSKSSRLDILKIHTRNVPLEKDVDLKSLSEVTHGFVGADLSALVKEAAIFAIKKVISDISVPKKEISLKILEQLKISKDDFDNALKIVQASALREVFVDSSNINFSDVGALSEQKDMLKDIINLSLNKKDLLKEMNGTPLKKILLYGPSGTGKTLLVNAASKEFGINYIYIKGPEIFDKWVGGSEKAIRDIFRKAKDVSPCILFIDEIDSITQDKGDYSGNNTKVLGQLLMELDNISNKDIIFIAATNRPDLIDKSFVRSGRIDKILEFKLPNKKDRLEIINLLIKKTPNKLSKNFIKEIVESTENFTGADLNLLISDSILFALKKNNYKKTDILEDHVINILKNMKSKIKDSSQDLYNSFKNDAAISKYVH
ncbi:MAG: AAA family ATPase [Candidatus ainarchaeum sp.]|nr:AAA family ATPase [Candidatus ainarchaeum sp.]MDD3976248.1 AAA family ATPase [Candidatus ainarchaeum sp.]